MDDVVHDAAQTADGDDAGHSGLDRLNECARTALDLARREAIAAGEDALCTEHLLVGLAETTRGAAKRVLDELNLDAEHLRATVRFIVGPGANTEPANGRMEYSPRTRRVLALAARDADKRGAAQIGTLNLLSGLLRERAGVAVLLLETPGVGLELAGQALSRAHREGWKDD